MYNLFTPISREGFNVSVLKPGMLVKFSVIEGADNPSGISEAIRIENTGFIVSITEDTMFIATTPSNGRIISINDKAWVEEFAGARIDSDRFVDMFKPAVNGGCFGKGDITTHITRPGTEVCVIKMNVDWAKQLSLKLSFLDEYGYDADIMCHTYYWR